MWQRCALITGLLFSVPAHADTPIHETSCAEATTAQSWYQTCLAWSGSWGPLYCSPPDITQCWDFETGLGGWTTTGAAFANQPTLGDNVAAWRVLQTKPSTMHPGLSMLDELNMIGGDYWETAYPIGNQGNAWLGTYENHPTANGTVWSSTQGDGPIGTATSPQFTIDRNLITFLVGGGCDPQNEHVEVDILEPPMTIFRPTKFGGMVCSQIAAHWVIGVDMLGNPMVATGACSEELARKTFLMNGLQGSTARVAVVDSSSGSWGHINVDHILHTNTVPADANGGNVPLWGFADTHAHFDNEHTSLSLGGQSYDGYSLHGSVGTVTADHNLLSVQLPSCDGTGHHTNSAMPELLEDVEDASLGASPDFPVGCDPGNDQHAFSTCATHGDHVRFDQTAFNYAHPSGGVMPFGHDLVGWPYWYTRAHQQMHLTWVQRAYAGGQRLMVASVGNTEVLGMALRSSHTGDFLSDYGALRRFAINMKALATANSTWMEIAKSPVDARRIIGQNKLAIVLATEVDDLGDHCAGDFTSTAADDPLDHAKTVSTVPGNPWNEMRDLTNAMPCTTPTQWAARVDNLYNDGYRVIMPVHLADNDLGGTAIYDDKWNTNSRFMTGNWLSVTTSSDVRYAFPVDPRNVSTWYGNEAGWTNVGGAAGFPTYTVAEVKAWVAYAYAPTWLTSLVAPGFVNTRPLTGNGVAVINAAKARGMIIDLAHMDQLGREKILGLASNTMSSPLNPGCDMSTLICQQTAYPAVSTHAGLRDLQPPRDTTGGGANEGGLRADMIARIRDIGGLIGVGTSAADEVSTDQAAPGSWSGINTQNVSNTCGGSTRTFAQSYVYALRMMNGKGITLGTDANGLEDRLNPRFGTQGCYARGNIPWSLQAAWDNSHDLVNKTFQVPINYRPAILGAGGTAGAQRQTEKSSSVGLNYQHYNLTPPIGGRFSGLQDPQFYISNVIAQNFSVIPPGVLTPDSMLTLSTLPPINAQVTGDRTFDYNYDGLAHYGMLPDMLQDSRVVGMTNEQLSPLFQGAESVVKTWERGCSLSDTTLSGIGCM